jgi:hypothetical protein
VAWKLGGQVRFPTAADIKSDVSATPEGENLDLDYAALIERRYN